MSTYPFERRSVFDICGQYFCNIYIYIDNTCPIPLHICQYSVLCTIPSIRYLLYGTYYTSSWSWLIRFWVKWMMAEKQLGAFLTDAVIAALLTKRTVRRRKLASESRGIAARCDWATMLYRMGESTDILRELILVLWESWHFEKCYAKRI